MTCDLMGPEQWRLTFSELEADFVAGVLARLGLHYQEDVSRLPPALRAYWRGSISRGEAGQDEGIEEAQEMLNEARTELRAERLDLVENWIREYELAEERNPWQVEISAAERDELIAMLNDRRMLLAAELGITEQDLDTEAILLTSEARRMGILEIEELGHMLYIILGPQIYRPPS